MAFKSLSKAEPSRFLCSQQALPTLFEIFAFAAFRMVDTFGSLNCVNKKSCIDSAK